jgi:hypothetical protein
MRSPFHKSTNQRHNEDTVLYGKVAAIHKTRHSNGIAKFPSFDPAFAEDGECDPSNFLAQIGRLFVELVGEGFYAFGCFSVASKQSERMKLLAREGDQRTRSSSLSDERTRGHCLAESEGTQVQ